MNTIAILSDIHANHIALDVLLADLERISPDRVVCLGDVAATGPGPHEVMSRLHHVTWDFVRGNCDDAILRFAAGDVTPTIDEHDSIDQWCAGQLSAPDLGLISSFQPVVTFTVEGIAVCCYHGSPRSNLDEILADTPVTDLDRWLRGFSATVYAGGHTHVQMVRRHGEAFIINPGSVGLPFSILPDGREINPLRIEYTVLRIDGGELAIELRRIPVGAALIREALAESAMPHAEWWGSGWS